eukprot:scaffold5629_cov135-Skeletonema_marinoi.AAC.1
MHTIGLASVETFPKVGWVRELMVVTKGVKRGAMKSVIITRRSSNIATTVAAAKIDQVNHRNIDRDLADRYYGILCRSCCPWIHQKRSLGRSITPVRWPKPAEHRRVISSPCCLPSTDLAAARASALT